MVMGSCTCNCLRYSLAPVGNLGVVASLRLSTVVTRIFRWNLSNKPSIKSLRVEKRYATPKHEQVWANRLVVHAHATIASGCLYICDTIKLLEHPKAFDTKGDAKALLG